LPVAEIAAISDGTTDVTIAGPGGDIDINVSGANVIDIAETIITIDDLVSLVAKAIISESIILSTAAGADGRVATNATVMHVGTTDTSDLELRVNSIPVLTAESTGKVALATVGTLGNQLIDKDYADNLSSGDPSTTSATSGQLLIPTSGDDIIIKWGVKSGTGSRAILFSDDTAAFPTAIYTVIATPQNTGSANSDGWWGVESLATTGFTWNSANRGSYAGNVNWLAIGV
jgi:hypothetical protein